MEFGKYVNLHSVHFTVSNNKTEPGPNLQDCIYLLQSSWRVYMHLVVAEWRRSLLLHINTYKINHFVNQILSILLNWHGHNWNQHRRLICDPLMPYALREWRAYITSQFRNVLLGRCAELSYGDALAIIRRGRG